MSQRPVQPPVVRLRWRIEIPAQALSEISGVANVSVPDGSHVVLVVTGAMSCSVQGERLGTMLANAASIEVQAAGHPEIVAELVGSIERGAAYACRDLVWA